MIMHLYENGKNIQIIKLYSSLKNYDLKRLFSGAGFNLKKCAALVSKVDIFIL